MKVSTYSIEPQDRESDHLKRANDGVKTVLKHNAHLVDTQNINRKRKTSIAEYASGSTK